jgi:hypothetical protein
MVNSNIQGAIPLAGQGYVAKNKGNYQAGQYRRLSNCEITEEGTIRSRRNITVCDANSEGTVGYGHIDNPWGFVGYLRDYAIVCSKTRQVAVTTDGFRYELWDPLDLPVTAATGWHKIVHAFKYNNVLYWLTAEWNPDTFLGFGQTDFYLHSIADNVYVNLDTILYADLTHTFLFTYEADYALFTSAFMQNDRLWISTNKRLYFSKATDPLTFAVPDGGFFNFPDTVIKYTFSLKDSLYILCDNSIYMLTYTDDPNTDAFVRKISDAVGGDWGVVHQDTPYFVNQSGVYSLNGTYMERMIGPVFDQFGGVTNARLYSFEEYLIVLRADRQNYVSGDGVDYYYDIGPTWDMYGDQNSEEYNVFFISTITGSMHVINFTDAPGAEFYGPITDIIVNPNKNFFGTYGVLFMTNRFVDEDLVAGTTSTKGQIYSMVPDRDQYIYDYVSLENGTLVRCKPRYEIEIDSYAPDGSEYFIKKFRNIELMGNFPYYDFTLSVAFDNGDYGTAIDLNVNTVTLEDAGVARPHYPARIGVNQRARSMSILLQVKNPWTTFLYSDTNPIYDQLEISDIRVLWGYTGRGPETKTPTSIT